MSKAIIVVDVQNGFVNGSTENIPVKIKKLLSLVDFDHRIFTKFINIPGGQYEALLNWSKLQSSPETDIHEALIGLETITIEKNFYSCVTKSFRAYVNRHRISEFYICGIDTDVCVMKAAVDLFEEELRPIVLVDCCLSHGGKEYHDAALKLMPRLIGRTQIVHDTEEHFSLPSGALKID